MLVPECTRVNRSAHVRYHPHQSEPASSVLPEFLSFNADISRFFHNCRLTLSIYSSIDSVYSTSTTYITSTCLVNAVVPLRPHAVLPPGQQPLLRLRLQPAPSSSNASLCRPLPMPLRKPTNLLRRPNHRPLPVPVCWDRWLQLQRKS